MRRENLPANELMGRRMESGVLAVLGQLEATRNWYRIGREWWFADAPATELGEQEWAYFESRGEKRVRKFAARATYLAAPASPGSSGSPACPACESLVALHAEHQLARHQAADAHRGEGRAACAG